MVKEKKISYQTLHTIPITSTKKIFFKVNVTLLNETSKIDDLTKLKSTTLESTSVTNVSAVDPKETVRVTDVKESIAGHNKVITTKELITAPVMMTKPTEQGTPMVVNRTGNMITIDEVSSDSALHEKYTESLKTTETIIESSPDLILTEVLSSTPLMTMNITGNPSSTVISSTETVIAKDAVSDVNSEQEIYSTRTETKVQSSTLRITRTTRPKPSVSPSILTFQQFLII